MGGRQRRVVGGRTVLIKVKVTPELSDTLKAQAAALGVSVQRLMVDSTLAPVGMTVTERHALWAELDSISNLLGRLGTNVNQIAATLNAGERTSLGSIIATARKVTETVERLEDVLEDLPTPPRGSAGGSKASP